MSRFRAYVHGTMRGHDPANTWLILERKKRPYDQETKAIAQQETFLRPVRS
jgi:hypothetical protein